MTLLPFPQPDKRDETTRLSQDAVHDMWHRIEEAMDSLEEAGEPDEDVANRVFLAIRCLDLLMLAVGHAIAEDNTSQEKVLDAFDGLMGALHEAQRLRRQESAA